MSTSRVIAAVELIASALRAQEEELAKLRAEAASFEKVRRLLKA
jgi:hypothetical protein